MTLVERAIMNKLDKLKKRGISLRNLNIVMLGLAILISAILIWAMNRTDSLYRRTHEFTQNLLQWRQDSYDLQVGSDYLTEQVRYFAVTGDRTFLDNYFEEALVTQRREKALDKLKQNHDNSEAVAELTSAMNESIQLMNLEYYSMVLTIEGYGYDINEFPEELQSVELTDKDEALSDPEKKSLAIKYLFNDEYLTSKRRISNDMNDCLDRLENEVAASQSKVADQLSKQVDLEHFLTFVLIGIMLGIVLATSVLVFRPLRNCVDLIRKDYEIPLKGAYEVRFLAKNYNLMYYTTKENENKLNFDANHDKMTGLYNRRGYDFFLHNVDMETSTLMIIDLDKFKEVNDTYGHDVGDKVITKAAKIIQNSFRTQDYVCRIGGDEFAVIMIRSDSSMKDLITRKVNLINEKIGTAEEEEGIPSISCSVGVAFGRVGLSVSDLFKRADSALYNTKKSGRKGVSFYSKKNEA